MVAKALMVGMYRWVLCRCKIVVIRHFPLRCFGPQAEGLMEEEEEEGEE